MRGLSLVLTLLALGGFYLTLHGARWVTRAGWRRLRAGDLDGALRSFRRAALVTRGAGAWLGVAAVHRAAGRGDDEAAALARAVARDGSDMQAFDARVDELVRRDGGKLGLAMAWLEARKANRRLGAVPRMMAQAQRGMYLVREEARRDEGIAELEAAWAVVADPEVGLALGRAYVAAGKPRQALPVLRRVADAAEELAAQALLVMMMLPGAGDAELEVVRARELARKDAETLRGEGPVGLLVQLLARAQGGDAEARRVLGEALARPEVRAAAKGELRLAIEAVLGPPAEVPPAEMPPAEAPTS